MKRPGITALLGLLFGPFGYLYLGSDYFLASGVSVLLFIKTLEIAHMTGPVKSWRVTLLIQVGRALEAVRTCRTRNQQLTRFWGHDEQLRRANVAGPITAAMELFVRLVLLYLD